MLNRVTIAGRLTKDPEIRKIGEGENAYTNCRFSLAVDGDRKDKDGNRKTEFFDFVAWRSAGDFVSRYFRKGDSIIVDGRLTKETWEAKDGSKRSNVVIMVDSAYFQSGRMKVQDAPAPVIDETPGDLPF